MSDALAVRDAVAGLPGPERGAMRRRARAQLDRMTALEPSFVARKWLNYLADDEGIDAIQAAYGPNYARLAEVKRRYDPDNIFRQNHNIAPAIA